MSNVRLFTEFSEDDPDTLEVWMDGEVIETLTHDEHGWAGIETVQRLVEKISEQM